MKAVRNANPDRNRFTIIPALLLASAVLAGCGSEFSTNPLTTTQAVDVEVGELILPDAENGLSTPRNLSARFSSPGTMLLTWASPAQAVEAILERDGVEVGRVPAQDGTFTDDLPTREPGVNEYTYSVSFCRGTQVGPESTVVGFLPRQDFQNSDPDADAAN